MATEGILYEHPELRPYVLSNVRPTGVTIGVGSYGSVEEVAMPGAICAAKKIHDRFLDRSRAVFVRECHLLSTLRHPNIVQFIGICFLPGSQLPALVMERLLTSLHDLLDPEPPFFPLSIKCTILHNVASGLAYLHEHSPPIIHRDLSASNILLDSGMVAKIADLGMAHIVPRMRAASPTTRLPRVSVYMPPEAMEYFAEYDESIDIFSFGVIAIFTLSQTYPIPVAPIYLKDDRVFAKTELERREEYMGVIHSQLGMKHPLLLMIEGCLMNFPGKRPRIHEVLHLLEEAKAEFSEEEVHISKLDLVRARLTRNQAAPTQATGEVVPGSFAREDDFVEPPSEDFFCPVTMRLLFEPHLTSCCGKHLSQEAATRIQGEGGPCPLCKEIHWSTVLNKHFRRQLNSLHVFCHNEDRGCGWQGELATLNHHLLSCPMKDAPPIPELHVNSENRIIVSNAPALTKKSFRYIGQQLDFIWEEGGISLHFPVAHYGVDIKISVTVIANIDEHSILPPMYRFMPAVSATYKITASATLPVPVRVRMEHCAILQDENSLVMMVAHKGPPYYFNPLDGVNFMLMPSYGQIETKRFSLFRFLWNLLGYYYQTRLSIQVLYHEDSTATFVVTKNLRAHITAVREAVKYIYFEDMPMLCESTTDALALTVPIESKGWRISPGVVPAEIKTLDINAYEPGQTCPKIKLRMEWIGKGDPKVEVVSIPIHGGSIKSFALLCKPNEPALLPSKPLQDPPSPPSEPQYSYSDRPTLRLLKRFPTRTGAILNIIQRIGTKNHDLGIHLLNDDTGAITSTIEAECRPDQTRTTEAILKKWLDGTGRTPHSWETLVTVLREIELNTLAQDVRDNF